MKWGSFPEDSIFHFRIRQHVTFLPTTSVGKKYYYNYSKYFTGSDFTTTNFE